MSLYTIEFRASEHSKWSRLVSPGDDECYGTSGDFDSREAALQWLDDTCRFSPTHYRVVEYRPTIPAPEPSWQDEEKADPAGVDSKIAWADKKVPLQMVPLKSLYGAARVFAYGRKKHGAGNFLRATMKDGAGERYAGADLRHMSERQELDGLWTNESLAALDPESGLPHIDHEIATLLMKRAILVKEGVLPLDPGEGNEPPKK